MNVLDEEIISDEESRKILAWWFKINEIITAPDKKGIMNDEESMKNYLEHIRNRNEVSHLIIARERLFYNDRHENLRKDKILFNVYDYYKPSLN